MQSLDDAPVDPLLPLDHAGHGVGEPLLELVVGLKDGRHEEVHQAPELHEAVLQRCPGQKDPVLGVEVQQGLPLQALPVLDQVRLVEDEEVPLLAAEHFRVRQDEGVARDTHVETVGLGPPLPLGLALPGASVVGEDLERRAPLLELHLPVQHHGGRHDDQVWAPLAFLSGPAGQQRYGLDRLAQPHLVGQDPIQALLGQGGHPLHAFHLVLSQGVLQKVRFLRAACRGTSHGRVEVFWLLGLQIPGGEAPVNFAEGELNLLLEPSQLLSLALLGPLLLLLRLLSGQRGLVVLCIRAPDRRLEVAVLRIVSEDVLHLAVNLFRLSLHLREQRRSGGLSFAVLCRRGGDARLARAPCRPA